MARGTFLAVLAAALLAPGAARAAEPKPIQDNSFLLEEAYNQEPGVIQHVSLFTRDRATGDWVYLFTEEWPARGQTHQVSVTLDERGVEGASGRETGFGDVALHYRWQALGSGEATVAVAPRLSLLLPTGSWRRGLGAGGVGGQASLPISVRLGPWFVGHFNLGGTWTPAARLEGERASSLGLNLGQSVVWLVHPRVNVLLEVAYAVAELDASAGTRTTQSLHVSPGIRGALDLPRGLQVVGGIAMPVGFGPSGGERVFLAYLSFEHPVTDAPW